MPSERTNNFPESGRGLGHVTPTIFGSTVGYPATAWLLVLYACYINMPTEHSFIDIYSVKIIVCTFSTIYC